MAKICQAKVFFFWTALITPRKSLALFTMCLAVVFKLLASVLVGVTHQVMVLVHSTLCSQRFALIVEVHKMATVLPKRCVCVCGGNCCVHVCVPSGLSHFGCGHLVPLLWCSHTPGSGRAESHSSKDHRRDARVMFSTCETQRFEIPELARQIH